MIVGTVWETGNHAFRVGPTRESLAELLAHGHREPVEQRAGLGIGPEAPKLVKREDLALIQHGAVPVDVAVHQIGCFMTSRPTTQANPTYEDNGIMHSCVANMPGAAAPTHTLRNVTLLFALADRALTEGGT